MSRHARISCLLLRPPSVLWCSSFALASTGLFLGIWVHNASPAGLDWSQRFIECRRQAPAAPAVDWQARSQAMRSCMAGVETRRFAFALGGAAATLGAGVVVMLAAPRMIERRRRSASCRRAATSNGQSFSRVGAWCRGVERAGAHGRVRPTARCLQLRIARSLPSRRPAGGTGALETEGDVRPSHSSRSSATFAITMFRLHGLPAPRGWWFFRCWRSRSSAALFRTISRFWVRTYGAPFCSRRSLCSPPPLC